MTKTYTHVGVATYKGNTKFRFTNGRADARVKTMTKEGFENIEFVPLPSVMTKAQALATPQAADISARYGIPIPSTAADTVVTDAVVTDAVVTDTNSLPEAA